MVKMSSKILIVDDEPEACTLLQKFLTRKGYQAASVASCREAIEKVRCEHPKVVLWDVCLPGLDGVAAIKRIKEASPKTGVIMITDIKEAVVAREVMELGAFDYIIKPLDSEYLEASLMTKIALLKK